MANVRFGSNSWPMKIFLVSWQEQNALAVFAKLQRFIDDRLLVVAEAASNTKRIGNDDRASYKKTHE